MRLFLPIILVIAAIGLFVVYTNGAYQDTKALSTQVTAYNDALDKSQELRSVRDQLLSKRNTFSTGDVQKLQEILPDNVDNIRLIIDINNIAARHSLSLNDVNLGDISNKASGQSALAVGSTGAAVGSVDIGFSVKASYDDMLSFVEDLEHSLRLIDIQKMSFTSTDDGQNSYTFSIRTYWLH